MTIRDAFHAMLEPLRRLERSTIDPVELTALRYQFADAYHHVAMACEVMAIPHVGLFALREAYLATISLAHLVETGTIAHAALARLLDALEEHLPEGDHSLRTLLDPRAPAMAHARA